MGGNISSTSTARVQPGDRRADRFVADFLGFAPDDLYAVSDTDLLHWDGAAWTVIDTAGAIDPSELTSMWGTSGGDLWLGDSQNGRVFHWDGARGRPGSRRPSRSRICGAFRGAAAPSSRAGRSACRGSGRRLDGIGDDVANEATGLWGFGPADIWAASDFGTLAHWDGALDGHRARQRRLQDGTNRSGAPRPTTSGRWATAARISRWNGARWTQAQVGKFPFYPFLNKVHGSSASDVWAVGLSSDGNNTGVILHYEP